MAVGKAKRIKARKGKPIKTKKRNANRLRATKSKAKKAKKAARPRTRSAKAKLAVIAHTLSTSIKEPIDAGLDFVKHTLAATHGAGAGRRGGYGDNNGD